MILVRDELKSYSPEKVFETIGRLPCGLTLDVGAAMGTVARQIQLASPAGRCICFEPWDGNLPHFQQVTEGIKGIELIRKAVADFDGRGVFYVPSKVEVGKGVWAKRQNYSSTGMLIPAEEAASKPGEKIFEVDVCSLDSTVDEQVRFLKIDVQGGEAAVLRGANRLLSNEKIDVLLVEFQGEEDVVELARLFNFDVYDIEYNAIPVGVEPSTLEFLPGATVANLSNGGAAIRGQIKHLPRELGALAEFMRRWRQNFGYIWTDLLMVRRGFVSEFDDALR